MISLQANLANGLCEVKQMAEYINKETILQKLSRMIDYCKKDEKVNALTALFQVGDAIMDCAVIIVDKKEQGDNK